MEFIFYLYRIIVIFEGILKRILRRTPNSKDYKVVTGNLTYKDIKKVFNKNLTFINIYGKNHSFWRSLEYNIINEVKDYFLTPCLDIGCGDGLFASTLFEKIDVGVDFDKISCNKAKKQNIYRNILLTDIRKTLPFKDSSFKTVFSNSVLEHVSSIDFVLKEIRRVLLKNGNFIFTVPSKSLETYLTNLYGKKESLIFNQRLYHINLFSFEEWNEKLKISGFEIIYKKEYLSRNGIILYRFLSSFTFNTLNRLSFKKIEKILEPKIFDYMLESLSVKEGACFLIIAKGI